MPRGTRAPGTLGVALALGVGVARAQAGLDLGEPHGSYGELVLERGFRPDPAALDVFTGGYRDARRLGLGRACVGWVAERPDLVVVVRASLPWLRIYATSAQADTALVIRTPDGRWRCNDDAFGGRHPSVDLAGAPQGLYRVWVANRRPRSRVRAMVYATAERARHP